MVDRLDNLDGFEFDEDFVLDDEVGTEAFFDDVAVPPTGIGTSVSTLRPALRSS